MVPGVFLLSFEKVRMDNLCQTTEPLVLDGRELEKNFPELWSILDCQEFKKQIGGNKNTSFTYTDDERQSLDASLSKFEGYCSPQANQIFERLKIS